MAVAAKPFDREKLVASLGEMQFAYDYSKQAHSYDYSRLRFLNAVDALPWYSEKQKLKGLGKRLLKEDPSDLPVEYKLVDLLSASMDLGEKREAVTRTQAMVRANPKRTSLLHMLAFAHFEVWYTTKKRSDANIAIAAYHKYLPLAVSAEERGVVQRQLKKIPELQARWEKEGKGTP